MHFLHLCPDFYLPLYQNKVGRTSSKSLGSYRNKCNVRKIIKPILLILTYRENRMFTSVTKHVFSANKPNTWPNTETCNKAQVMTPVYSDRQVTHSLLQGYCTPAYTFFSGNNSKTGIWFFTKEKKKKPTTQKVEGGKYSNLTQASLLELQQT